MAASGIWRTSGPQTVKKNWQWIGGYGGGYAHEYTESDMRGVPEWVRDVLMRLLKDSGFDIVDAAGWNEDYELTGKNYRYRFVFSYAGQGNAVVDIFRRKRYAKGAWRTWDWNLSESAMRREWRRKKWQDIGQVHWHPVGTSRLSKLLSRGQTNDENVPTWVQDQFCKRLNEEGATISEVDAHLYYELKGKRYSYRIVPTLIETGKVEANVFSRFRKPST